ncbi:MAG: CGNR zinc finger domain-containing protein [Steroidobacter sp.]
MATQPAVPSFVYLGGDPALDLVNTVDWTPLGTLHEQLTTYHALTAWAEGAGVISATVRARLRRAARRRPQEAVRVLRRAREIRAILQGVFTTEAHAGERSRFFEAYNLLLHQAVQRLELRTEEQERKSAAARMRWSWASFGESLDSLLWPIVWSAATLLVSEEADRIRTCGGEDCGWVYVDRSRNGLRRWCRMEICGTQAKSRRRRARNAQ